MLGRKGHTFKQPKPVSYHVDMHFLRRRHLACQSPVSEPANESGASGNREQKPSPNPGHPQELARKSGWDTLGAENFPGCIALTGLTRGPHSSIQWHRLLQHFTVIWGNWKESFLEGVQIKTMDPLMHPIATTFVSLYLIHPSSMTVRGFKESKNKWFVMSWNARERLFLDNWASF